MNAKDKPRTAPATSGADAREVIIIGGGIAGLSCGCYLQMNGIQSEILEMGTVPGGLCTSWDRGPYVFDGCLRWLFGTNPSSAFYQIWMELGAIADRKIMLHDEVVRIESADGHGDHGHSGRLGGADAGCVKHHSIIFDREAESHFRV